MGRKPKNPKLEHGVNAGTDDESLNEEHDDMGGLVSPPSAKESVKEKSTVSPAPTEEATGKEKNIVSSAATEEAMTENVVTEQLNSSQPGPSSSKQTLEQQVEFLMQAVKSLQAPEGDYKTLYLESQKKVEALTKENHGLELKLESAVAKVEVYDKVREAIGSLKDLKVLSRVTKGPDVLAEIISQVASGPAGTTPAVATQPSLNASSPQTATGKGTTRAKPRVSLSPQATGTTSAVAAGVSPSQATGAQGSPSAVAAEPGSSELRRSKRDRKKKDLEN